MHLHKRVCFFMAVAIWIIAMYLPTASYLMPRHLPHAYGTLIERWHPRAMPPYPRHRAMPPYFDDGRLVAFALYLAHLRSLLWISCRMSWHDFIMPTVVACNHHVTYYLL